MIDSLDSPVRLADNVSVRRTYIGGLMRHVPLALVSAAVGAFVGLIVAVRQNRTLGVVEEAERLLADPNQVQKYLRS